jgi:RecB family endonuclease NucS
MSEADSTVPRAVRLLVARCEVVYTGRLTAWLPEAVRLLMFKVDGSFLVHDDAGGYRPLNRIRSAFRTLLQDRFSPGGRWPSRTAM